MVVHSYAWWQMAWLVIYAHVRSYILMYSHVWFCIDMHESRRLGWSYMIMYSHVWLCIADMHGGRRLGWSCMLMYSRVWLCIAMHDSRRLGWSYMVMYSHVWSCIAMHGGRRLGWSRMLIGFLDSYSYIGVSCDTQERKEKMCTRFLSLMLLLWYLYQSVALDLHKQFCHPRTFRLRKSLQDGGVNDEDFFKPIEEVETSCDICCKYKHPPSKLIVYFPMSKEFNESVVMDIKYCENHIVLHLIDHQNICCYAGRTPETGLQLHGCYVSEFSEAL